MAEENMDAGDMISELPEPLLHCILSFIPTKDAARTSVLSKRWNQIWATLPYLDLGQGFFNAFVPPGKERCDPKQLKKNKRLLELANKIILRRSQQIVSIEKLRFVIPKHTTSRRRQLPSPSHFDSMVERLIPCVANRGLKELDFRFHWFLYKSYNLPTTILSAKSLNVLSLLGFDLRSFSSLDIKFPSMRKLLLQTVLVEDGIVAKFIAGCPLLENLHLEYCEGLETIYVTRLLKLKVLEVIFDSDLKILEIEAPDLQVLDVSYPSPSFQVNVADCSSLSTLRLCGRFVTDMWFHHFISQCVFVENIRVGSLVLEKIKISTNTLKTFYLSDVGKTLVEVEINAPNLEQFHFRTRQVLSTIMLNAPDSLEIELEVYSKVDDCWHSRLAKFLGYFNHFNTVKLTGASDQAIILPEQMRVNLLSPLFDTRNLIFFSREMEFKTVELVEYMLWLSPHADTLTITCEDAQSREKTKVVMKFQYAENVHKDSSCFHCKYIDCWLHSLSEIRVEKFERDEDERRTIEGFFYKHVKNLKIEGLSIINYLCDGLYSDYDQLF